MFQPLLILLFILIGFLLLFSVGWLLRRNDEVPLILSGFSGLFFWRLKMLASGRAEWTIYDYGILFTFDIPTAIRIGYYMLLGTVLIIGVYCWRRKPAVRQEKNAVSFTRFIDRHRLLIVAGALMFSLVNLVFRASGGEESAEVGSSYVFLLGLTNCSFIILLFLLLTKAAKTWGNRLLFALFIASCLFSGFSSSLRFQFLGWAVVLVILCTARLRPMPKLLVLSACGVLGGFGFTMMGLFRYEGARLATFQQLSDVALDSMSSGNDFNMIDGFIMSEQVFPKELPYQYGLGHLEVFVRPIPRALWPGKPVGGWAQKFGQANGGSSFNTGISPSLYGSFYEEGGVIAIILLAAVYGWMFAAYMNAADRLDHQLKWLMRGILAASLFAIIRGGDMPGIAAFIGMSYWPILLLLWSYRRQVVVPSRRIKAHAPRSKFRLALVRTAANPNVLAG